jgi:hypothetical protein
MTGRDRMVLMGVAVIALLGAVWLLAVSPKRQEASKLAAQVAETRTQLSSAEGEVKNARAAQEQYSAAYASVVSLGKAVPANQEVPSLIYEISRASNQKHVEFTSITASSSGTGTGPSASAAAASPAAAASGFSQMPFTFVFNGNFFALEHLFQQLNRFTVRSAAGGLAVSGRLLTIQSVKLAPATTAEHTGGGSQPLSGTITATAYVLPAGQGLTGGASPASPGATTPASSGTAPSTPAPAAVVKVTP